MAYEDLAILEAQVRTFLDKCACLNQKLDQIILQQDKSRLTSPEIVTTTDFSLNGSGRNREF